jgi:hypothetical protein
MRSRLAVEDCGKDANYDWEDQCQEASFRLVNAVVAASSPLYDPVRTVAKQWKRDCGDDDLAGIDVRSGAVRPAIRRRRKDGAVSGANCNVNAESQAVQTECPEDIGKQKNLECVLGEA